MRRAAGLRGLSTRVLDNAGEHDPPGASKEIMPSNPNPWLITGAALSAIAAMLHACIILGGARWYRFFGAGERMARAAERASWRPTVITAGIALVLFVWMGYALSGAGAIPALPLTRVALPGITAVYLLRGLLFIPVLSGAGKKITPFAIWSSVICLGYGLVHLVGTIQVWNML